MSYTVYMHTCPNGKKYIGITSQYPYHKRFENGNGYKRNVHFTNAIKKYGWENIEHKIMSNWHTQEEAEKLERYLIEMYKTNNRNYGYNKTNGGEINKKPNEETREKLRQAQLGKKLSEETKAKLSKAHKGKLAHKKGVQHTKQAIQKIIDSKNIKVVQFTLNGKKHKQYSSIKEACIENGWTSPSSISAVCKGKRYTAYGYIWKYKDNPFSKEDLNEVKIHHKKPIRQVKQFSINGDFIKHHNSIAEAIRYINRKKSGGITQNCQGKQKTAYGYRWEYAEEQT